MGNHNTYITTETEYVNRCIRLWGEDEVEYLYEQGFLPRLTERGWRWLLPLPDLTNSTPAATMRTRRGSPVPR